MSKDDENVLSRIKLFLIDNPSSSALQIASAINVSRQKIQGLIPRDQQITWTVNGGNKYVSYSLVGMPALAPSCGQAASTPQAPCALPVSSPLAAAISALMWPLTQPIRDRFERDLAAFAQQAIETAIADAQRSIMTKLATSFQPGILSAVETYFSTMPATEGDPITATGLIVAQKGVVANDSDNTPSKAPATAAPEKTKPAEAKPVEFTAPAGTFVPKDVVSKRTAHKTAGFVPAKDPAPSPAVEPDAKPRLQKNRDRWPSR